MAFGVLHLARREAADRRMSMWLELGLLASLWAIVNFTAVNLYLKWTGGRVRATRIVSATIDLRLGDRVLYKA